MPKNSADPKHDRSDNRADSKNEQQNNAHFTEEAQTLTSKHAAEYAPNVNGISKNIT
ncbi:hypothetical protein [Paenibacillus hexagrammi]|uniref:Uncharacterized protein n=1 Tax=Paenibacillus hexagrammi TaxID=2908839 RepID=A0ABY3SR50_9BACL|nr:hypothetical protein [Paenibacillus sp. YPD9-1]UJF35461.1 hypothetical protein L0M14_10360 [Paenibacillus sp. YPD9-1]